MQHRPSTAAANIKSSYVSLGVTEMSLKGTKSSSQCIIHIFLLEQTLTPCICSSVLNPCQSSEIVASGQHRQVTSLWGPFTTYIAVPEGSFNSLLHLSQSLPHSVHRSHCWHRNVIRHWPLRGKQRMTAYGLEKTHSLSGCVSLYDTILALKIYSGLQKYLVTLKMYENPCIREHNIKP